MNTLKQILSFFSIFPALFLVAALETKSQILTATLRVNYDTIAVVGKYQQLLFKLTLVNYQAYYDEVWNSSTKAQIASLNRQYKRKRIKEADYRKKKAALSESLRVINVDSLGSIQTPWQTLCTLHIKRFNDSNEIAIQKTYRFIEEPFVATMTADSYYTTPLGIDSAEIKRLDTGLYEARVIIEGIQSTSVKFLITGERKEPGSRSASELRATAAFYQQFDSLNAATRYTELLLQKFPEYLPGHVLMSELSLSKSDFGAAIRHADIAIELYYKQGGDAAHPPDYLIALRNVALAREGKGN